MRLSAVILENFRAYRSRIRIPLDELTAFVGRNDSGKSSILEALEIFFNSESVKFEPGDRCVYTGATEVRIGCAFTDLPHRVVLDEAVSTTLPGEYLVNELGELEIHHVFDSTLKNPKARIVALAQHPAAPGASDLLELKVTELKKRAAELGVDLGAVDQRVSSAIRASIWASRPALLLRAQEIPLEKEEGKRIWEMLKKQLPVYALFQADRPSKDQDPEVQDPMKLAVKEALRTVSPQLDAVMVKVREHATELAQRTLEKLRDMDPDLAGTLTPQFASDPRWDSLFKLALTADDGIPVNKRGSGVRRLILLNFFRATAERRRQEASAPGIIYAVEEPETSQHPDNQRALMGALADLSDLDGVQVLLTTHVPALAGLLPVGSLRHVITTQNGEREVQAGSEDVFAAVASTLGVLPDPRPDRVKVLVFVEGPHDVEFLRRVSKTMAEQDPEVLSLGDTPCVAFVPTGGSTLKAWIDQQYLRRLGLPEVHLYDRDDLNTPKYQAQVDLINGRGDGSYARLTDKRELENYLDVDSVMEAYREMRVTIQLTPFGDWDDVPEMVARATHEASGSGKRWEECDPEAIGKKTARAKHALNRGAATRLTCDRLRARGGYEELASWLKEVARRCA